MHKQKSSRSLLQERTNVLKTLKSFSLHSSDFRRVLDSFFIHLDTPVSLACYLLLKYEEFDQLVTKDVDPQKYESAAVFRDDLAAISLLRKASFIKTSFNKKENALASFAEGEISCQESNQRIKSYLSGSICLNMSERILSSAIRKIEKILGPFDIDSVIKESGWGPGSTLSVTGDCTAAALKYDSDSDITADAYALYGEVYKEAFPRWDAFSRPNFVKGNKICTVPKNAKTDRTIAIEPGLNSFIQAGIGRLIRRRLRASGFNLNSDYSNQDGAFRGSITGEIATVDFKAASDTISLETVRLLLPPLWFEALNAARSKRYTLNGETKTSYKFSTMGCGFTFELESLIFVALGLAVCESSRVDDCDVSIFGDDLVLPSSCVPDLIKTVQALGFTINTSKSYWTGNFRESCGTYFFNGVDVKPFFLKEKIIYAKDVFKLANGLLALSHRYRSGNGCDIRFRSTWSLIVHLLPVSLRLFGPVSSGDGCLHSNAMSAPTSDKNGWEGFYFSELASISLHTSSETFGFYLAKLRGLERSDRNPLLWSFEDPPVPLIGNTINYRQKVKIVFKQSFTKQWYNFGEWT